VITPGCRRDIAVAIVIMYCCCVCLCCNSVIKVMTALLSIRAAMFDVAVGLAVVVALCLVSCASECFSVAQLAFSVMYHCC
jgi:hypothetical protein